MRQSFCILIALGLFAGQAGADEREWRLSVAGVVSDAMATNESAHGSGINPGARLRFGYGLRNWLEVGGTVGFVWAPALVFPGTMIQGQPGSLHADIVAVELAGSVRLVADFPFARSFFARNRPFVDLRGGLLLEIMRSPKLLDANNDIVLDLSQSVMPLPFVGVTVGIEHRFAGSWIAGVSFDYAYAGHQYQSLGANLELSWLTY